MRDIYTVPEQPDHLLFVATDRISAFDCIMPTPVPCKGEVLTQLSLFWFELLANVMPSHLVSSDVARFGEGLQGRSMLVRRAKMIEVECVARGYLAGSGWKEYLANGTVCGIRLPAGLRENEQLPEPIFTPASKALSGHDQNIAFAQVVATVGEDLAQRLRALTLALYERAAEYASARGIILADTKFEFGFVDDCLTLADEVLTPDSSRWWPAASYEPGRAQPSFDKQYVRDYLETLAWNKQPPAPALPPEVIEGTTARYREAYRLLTEEIQ